MTRTLRSFLCLLLAIVFVCGLFPAASFAADGCNTPAVSDALGDILAYKVKSEGFPSVQDWLDSIPMEEADGAVWYVLALAQGEAAYELTGFAKTLREYVRSKTVANPVVRLRYALAFAACGVYDGYIPYALDSSIGQQGIMSLIFGLHLLNNGYETSACTPDTAVDELLALQLADGGWALNGETADADVTAMTVQALAPHCHRAEVQAAADRAVDCLAGMQLASGGFVSYGKENPESGAQVLIALSALGIDGLSDPRFIKDGGIWDGIRQFALGNGSYRHLADSPAGEMPTVQVLLALTAYQRYLAGDGSLYLYAQAPAASDDPAVQFEGVPAPNEASGAKSKEAALSGKVWLCAGIAGVYGGLCLVLALTKKANRKNLLFFGIAALVLAAAVLFIDVQSTQDFYAADLPGDPAGTVTLSVRCDTLSGRAGDNPAKAGFVPEDGTVLAETVIPFAKGETVFDALVRAAKQTRLHMEYSGTDTLAYIAGIGHLYEFDYGDLSGWMYFVNGESPSVGCGEYALSDGDMIVWRYTCDLGEDLK